ILMLVGSALLVRTLRNLLAIEPGFKGDNVVVTQVEMKNGKSPEAYDQFYASLIDRLKGVQVISGVSTAEFVPLTGAVLSISVNIEGRPQTPGANQAVDLNQIGPRYHELMGILIIKGRGFTDQDRQGAQPVTIVNESFAQTFYPGEDPIGKRIRLGTRNSWIEIVGVAGDARASDLTAPSGPHIDLPLQQRGYGPYAQLVVSSTGSPSPVSSLGGVW
ncbi:MAG: ABC transporter permease, partial [Blastocatellia bacterium]